MNDKGLNGMTLLASLLAGIFLISRVFVLLFNWFTELFGIRPICSFADCCDVVASVKIFLPVINFRNLKNIISIRNTKIARLRPTPKTKKGPVRSFNRIGTLREVVDFVLAKHIGAGGKEFFCQSGGSPVSQSSIKLLTYIIKKGIF